MPCRADQLESPVAAAQHRSGGPHLPPIDARAVMPGRQAAPEGVGPDLAALSQRLAGAFAIDLRHPAGHLVQPPAEAAGYTSLALFY